MYVQVCAKARTGSCANAMAMVMAEVFTKAKGAKVWAKVETDSKVKGRGKGKGKGSTDDTQKNTEIQTPGTVEMQKRNT